ncbi:MAG: biopolymer transporter ExbD [Rickettsiales bacterium]|nr:biopolymer transporter ExbD [Rickettsiales bacterium]
MHNNFDRDDLHAPLAEINTTPLVDVLLVLLVIFLVTAPMLQSAIKLKLPTESAAVVDDKESIVVSIDAAGQYYFNDSPFSAEDISRHLVEIAKEDPNHPISIRADESVDYGKVSRILADTATAGLTDVRFITERKN